MDKAKKIIEDIKSGWEKLERKKRIGLISVVSIVFIIILTFTYITQKTDYQVLFNDLDDADAGMIVEDLESKGMNYKLDNDGKTILIDEKELDNYRIELAVDGLLPSKSTGFEIFDSANMMATDDDRAIMYQRALSGELERSISSLENVNSANIILNIPEDSVFQNPEYQKDASASVVLDMQTNESPNQQHIQGIASLVSASIDNLPIENVKIVDTNGNLLSNSLGNGANDTSVANEHQKIKKSVEADLENKVLNLLGAIYGHDKVYVSVNTQLNFDAIEREEVEFDVPESSEDDKGLIRSQQEQASGEGISRVDGSTLDDDNVTDFSDDEEEGNNSTYDHTTNYELDSSTSHIVKAPGTIDNISASVVVNGKQEGKNLELLVRNALGILPDMDNGNIEIEYVDDATEDEAETLPDLNFISDILDWLATNWWILLIVFFVLILIIIVVRLIINRRRAVNEIEEEEEPPVIIEEEERKEDVITEEMKAKARENEISKEKEDTVRKEAKENPELVAELLKIWLNEKE